MQEIADRSEIKITVSVNNGARDFHAFVLNGARRVFFREYTLPPIVYETTPELETAIEHIRAYRIVFDDCIQRGFISLPESQSFAETEYDAYFAEEKKSIFSVVKNSFKKRFSFISIFGASK